MGSSRVAVWKVLFPNKFDLDGFSTLFAEEMDSWFSADIACCDSCYETYSKAWPGLVAKGDFQRNGIPLDCFFSGSSFAEIYSESEFLELCRQMGCPVCRRPLEYNIWPYEPPFRLPDGLSEQIAELEGLLSKTPFLVLEHPLAKRVRSELRQLAARTASEPQMRTHFRARAISTPKDPTQFLPPPAAKCDEGRYNHAGRPVLYLASDREVAFCEIGAPKEGVLVAEVKLLAPLKILDLSTEELPSDLLQAITASSLLSAPRVGEGWDKREYTFSRFVADCAVDAGLSGIRYPSVVKWEGANLVVLSPGCPWDKLMQIATPSVYIPV